MSARRPSPENLTHFALIASLGLPLLISTSTAFELSRTGQEIPNQLVTLMIVLATPLAAILARKPPTDGPGDGDAKNPPTGGPSDDDSMDGSRAKAGT